MRGTSVFCLNDFSMLIVFYSRISLKLRTRDGDVASPNTPDNIIRPKECVAIIKSQIEQELVRQNTQW